MKAISDQIKSFKGGDFKQQGEVRDCDPVRPRGCSSQFPTAAPVFFVTLVSWLV